MLPNKNHLRFIITLLITISVVSCNGGETHVKLPQPLRPSLTDAEYDRTARGDIQNGTEETEIPPDQQPTEPSVSNDQGIEANRFTKAPGTAPTQVLGGLERYEGSIPELKGGAFKLNIDNMPLVAFINEVYGNMLHVSYQIDKSLQSVTDLVTVRITEPQTGEQLAHFVAKVLADYGVAIKKEAQYYRFVRGTGAPTDEPPLLISGRTLPSVPITHRPIFQIVPLIHVRNANVSAALNQIYSGQNLKITDDLERNAIMIQGPRQLVASALDTIKFLDQPAMRGRYSLRIDPLYQTPDNLSEALVEVLQSEGYGASSKLPMGSILILPMGKINAVFVFAADPNMLDLVKQWVEVLDKPTYGAEEDSMFYYAVKNTSAKDLAKTLSGLVPTIMVEQTKKEQKTPGAAAQASAPNETPTTTRSLTGGKSSLVVDEQRNAILFFGATETWQQILSIIRQMDVPSKQVLIEVTIAEVTLGETDKFGIEWLINGKSGEYTFTAGTLASAAAPVAGALNFFLDSGGQTKMVMNALATDSRVNVLSTPRLMVKSGDEASIEIGTEVPIITSQGVPSGSPQTGGDSIFTQNVQYRKTGVILNIKPIVHSGKRIDIELSQELSSAEENTVSSISSPSILNRKVETALSLKDGASVLLAGLISDRNSLNDKGVPFFKDLPWLGSLFRTRGSTRDKSEIVVMIIPYILEDDGDAEAISETFRKQYSFEKTEPTNQLQHYYPPEVYR